MIAVLIAVIDDLFQFASRGISGAVPYNPEPQKTLPTYQKKLEKIQSNIPVVYSLTQDRKYTPPTQTHENISSSPIKISEFSAFKVGYQYFVGDIDVYFYNDPVLAFDGAFECLSYGTQVRLVGISGRWAQVRRAGRIGWIFKDTLMEDANGVYPRFLEGIEYDALNQQTVKLRACIDDFFGGARGEHPLSPSEYIYYRLQQKRRPIDWGDVRMRIPGTWQRKLRGRSGVHIGVHPKTESVMEYSIDDMGYLAFVEAVFPDGSIHITQIGKSGSNQYTDQMLTEVQARALNPVYLEVL